jgi:hypothetical protein
MQRLVLAFFCLVATAWGQSCPPKAWCDIQDRNLHPSSMPKDNGWNNIFFSPDTHRIYVYADEPTSPPTWETTFWSYRVQKTPQVSNVWEKVSRCGDTNETSVRQQRLELHAALGATDTRLQLDVMNPPHGPLSRPHFPQSGTIWVGDEAMDFSSCSSEKDPDNCPMGSTSPLTLSRLRRGVRQAAGWLPASAHAAGEPANLACPGPFVPGHSDHPISRHPVGCTTYDSKRGRIWLAWGYQEIWKLQDTWYLCVTEKAECTQAQIKAGWQRLPLFTTGGENPPGIAENAMVYDPDHDVIMEFGGTSRGRAISETNVFCLSAGAGAAYGCTNTAHLNKWIHVASFHGGSPAASDANRMTYDTANHRILIYGGNSSGLLYLVQQYDAGSGDWCMSDPEQGGRNSNAAWCKKLPKVSYPAQGHPPGLRFPAWTFDKKRGVAALYAGPDSLYLYDASANQWTLTDVAGGPDLPRYRASQSMAYADEPDDTYIWKSSDHLWQLPGSAISSPVGSK